MSVNLMALLVIKFWLIYHEPQMFCLIKCDNRVTLWDSRSRHAGERVTG